MTYNPGFDPLEYNVIVLPNEAEKVTAGGIHIPDTVLDKEQLATTRGTLVSMSPIAFNYDDYPTDQIPKVGQEVLFNRYEGKTFEGADGRTYRLIKDKAIQAVMRD